MREAIVLMDRSMGDAESFIRADHAFHVALAEGTQNPLLPMLIDSIGELVRETRHLVFEVTGSPSRGQHYHRELLEAVERHDGATARKTMGEHLDQFDADIRLAKNSH